MEAGDTRKHSGCECVRSENDTSLPRYRKKNKQQQHKKKKNLRPVKFANRSRATMIDPLDARQNLQTYLIKKSSRTCQWQKVS